MSSKERIDLYLSGLADRDTEIKTENAMLEDAGLFRQFIETCEQFIYAAPPGFAGSVMRGIREQGEIGEVVVIPGLSKKMCAAVCFCSAAAIMIFTVFGVDRHVADFFANHAGRLGEILSAIKFL